MASPEGNYPSSPPSSHSETSLAETSLAATALAEAMRRGTEELLVSGQVFSLHPADYPTAPDGPAPDEPRAWWIEEGRLDLYAELAPRPETGCFRQHLMTLVAGDVFFALPDYADLRLLVASRGTCRLRRQHAAQLSTLEAAEMVPVVERWISHLGHLLGRLAPGVDFVDQVIVPGKTRRLGEGERLAAHRGVVWAEWRSGEVEVFARAPLGGPRHEGGPYLLPLTSRSWLEARTEVELEGRSTTEVLATHGLAPLLDLHPRILELLRSLLVSHHRAEERRLERKASHTQRDRHALLERLSTVIDSRPPLDEGIPPLLAACRRIGRHLGVEVRPSESLRARGSVGAEIEAISRRSRLRARPVLLRGRWWLRETSPMLAFRRDQGGPLVLLPGKGRRLVWTPGSALDDPGVPVDEAMAATVAPMAYSFYRVLPDQRLDGPELLRFAAATGWRDLRFALAFAAAGTLMGLSIPIALGVVIDITIPSHQPAQLVAITLALVVASLASLAFQICRDLAVVRFGGRLAEAIQPAIIDRLLRLPNNFFRRYSAGDLAERVITLEHVQSRLGEGALSALVMGAASLANFALLFYLAPRGALVAFLLLFFLLLLLAGTLWRQVVHWTRIHHLEGRLSSLVLETIAGIRRIRLAAAEDRFFVRWGRISMDFRDQLTACYTNEVRFNAFARGYQILCLAVLFAILAPLAGKGASLSTGAFLAFIAAFTVLSSGFVQMAQMLLPLVELVPMFRRIRPVIDHVPENDEDKLDPGVLSGELEIHELVFRYEDGRESVIEGLSLQVAAGEHVAIVGPSGCGKSTLFRLILGFEQPTAGGIYLDGKDLASLDLREVRHQIGVVLQRDQLMEATIYENIQGDDDIDLPQAWEAARQCGIARDIEAMPLGMHTVISAEGSDLSGGQVQRLLIARALASRPRILLFDEATSALDNKTQAIVTESLDHLRVTRIAIAHRLSTVRHADRIFVMDKGKIVEQGTYDQLMDARGAFADLVRRQLR